MSNKFNKKPIKDVEGEEATQSSDQSKQQKFRPKNRGPKSTKKSQRDESRMVEFRGRQGEKTVQENRAALLEKLFYGFNNVNEALKTVQTSQVNRTVILPVSTRSAGFIIRNLMVEFIQLNVIDIEQAKLLASSLYRVTLLQLDLKLEEAKLLQHSRNLGLESYEDVSVNSDQRRALELMGPNFSPLVNYISSLGLIKTAAKNYLPRHPKVIEPGSNYVHQRFGVLRRTVEYLASPNTPNEIKYNFFRNCPFPSATWAIRMQPDGMPLVTLTNPNTIMPQEYGVQGLRDDIALIASHVEKIGRKYPKYISTGGIDWKGTGATSLLVSNTEASIGCPSWPTNGAAPLSVTGEFDIFWTPEILSDPEVDMGVIYMFGEMKLNSYVDPCCIAFRSEASACRYIYIHKRQI